jgi:hypothetical protein
MPRHDPYLNDPNVRTAAGMQLVAALCLGALLGWAIVGWFDLGIGEGAGAAIGAAAGFLLANVLVYRYGGRSTR